VKEETKTPAHAKAALRLLSWFCPAQLYEEIEGDLIQKFNKDVKTTGVRRAKHRLIWNVLRFFRPGIVLRNSIHINLIDRLMLGNNLLVAFRHIRKDKSFSGITIFGLTISMTACLLIFQYAFFELSYDSQFQKTIYRLGITTYESGLEHYKSAIIPAQVAPVLKEKFPEIMEATRLVSTSGWFNCTLAYSEGDEVTIFNENSGFYFVDPSFVSQFEISFLQGDHAKALQKPYSMVLSATAAKKYFGNSDPLGKIVKLRGSFQTHDYTVTGVMNDFPTNSHLDVNIVASLNSLADPVDSYTYIQLAPETDLRSLTQKLDTLAATMIPAMSRVEAKVECEPISSIYLHSNLEDQPKATGNALSIYFLMLVAIIVLVMAWINYINLFTSRSVARAKEVGVRKITGATRFQITFQFLTETFVYNFISIILAFLLISLLSARFYEWIGLSAKYYSLFTIDLSENTIILCALVGVGILISGVFPAHLISSLAPNRVLKGKLTIRTSRFSFRKVAVVFQFSCAIILTMLVIVFQQQFKFMKDQVLGIDIKRSIVLKAPANVDSTYLLKLSGFKQQLQSLAVIHSITTSTDVPGNVLGTGWNGGISKVLNGPSMSFGINLIDPDFIQAYQLKLLAGRNFTEKDFPGEHFGDKQEPVIINRRAAELLSYAKPEDAIGGTVFWGDNPCLIVGVLEEFHQESLKKAIQPMFYTANMGPSMTLKLTQGADKKISLTISQIREAWDTYFPDNAFDYFFLEDNFNKQYADDERMTRLFNLFCLLALVISCLGIFALSLFSISQRVKEISIRKVLGASVFNLFRLLTKEYFILIGISSVVSLPIAWWITRQWLNSFALKMELSNGLLFIPVIFILMIALFTVSGHALKASLKNPVDNLKHE
jgi:putative ABC transport system permease protein